MRRGDGPLGLVAIGCFVVGVALLLPFETPVTLTLGVLFLLAFIVCGAVFLVGPGSGVLGDDDAADDASPTA
jgi:hypothetical protein